MTIIVSDTSPVRALAHLGLLPVLETLFGEVLVPDSVAQELLDPPSSFARIDVADFGFLKVSCATNRQRVAELREQLDFGEAEAIALAQEVRAEALLIDERAGRNAARQLGLSPLGTVGLLLRAKERGLCGDIAPLLDQLRSELRFFISGSFYVHALRLAGELPPLAQ